MSASIKQILKTAIIRTELATSAYGTSAPTMQISLPNGTSYRYTKAVLHHLAEMIELATPAGESWCVEIARVGDVTGTIVIELVQGTPAEAARAMALLQQVASAQ